MRRPRCATRTPHADHLRTAVELWRNSGNPGLESRTLVHLGDALLAAGHRGQAQDAFTQCLALGTAADPQRIADARERLADLRTH
ncbi:hypothetical protein ACFUNF_38295 [Streptomyces sp. NPDC057291]|uniref:hypothetical protein n=1 Tax=Streptomyces sp. NPDC057291 TaxID=3346087 RepID=UPI00363FFEAE